MKKNSIFKVGLRKLKQETSGIIKKKTKLEKTDVFLVSYPKSGRTWMRVMLIRFLQLHFGLELNPKILGPTQLKKFNPKIPVIKMTHGVEGNPLELEPQELDDLFTNFRGKKIILLVRDPRDVLISSYFHKKNRNEFSGDKVYGKSLSEFLYEKKGGLDTLLKYYQIWYEKKSYFKDFLLVKYENFHINPSYELTKICKFIGIEDIDEKKIDKAVDFSSFTKMHEMEIMNKFENEMLKPSDVKNVESFKTRKGKVGGFRDYLNENEIEYINQKILKNMPEWYGYNTSIRTAS